MPLRTLAAQQYNYIARKFYHWNYQKDEVFDGRMGQYRMRNIFVEGSKILYQCVLLSNSSLQLLQGAWKYQQRRSKIKHWTSFLYVQIQIGQFVALRELFRGRNYEFCAFQGTVTSVSLNSWQHLLVRWKDSFCTLMSAQGTLLLLCTTDRFFRLGTELFWPSIKFRQELLIFTIFPALHISSVGSYLLYLSIFVSRKQFFLDDISQMAIIFLYHFLATDGLIAKIMQVFLTDYLVQQIDFFIFETVFLVGGAIEVVDQLTREVHVFRLRSRYVLRDKLERQI